VFIIGQSKIIEGKDRLYNKINKLIASYKDLFNENKSLKELVTKLERELKDRLEQHNLLEGRINSQVDKIIQLEKSLKNLEDLRKSNTALKEDLNQISLEFQNTKDELQQAKSQAETLKKETKQEVVFMKKKIRKMIDKIDNVLSGSSH